MIHSHSATVRCGTRSFAARASFPCLSRRRRARARRAGQAAGPVLIGLKGGALRAKLADIMAVPPPPPPSLHPPASTLPSTLSTRPVPLPRGDPPAAGTVVAAGPAAGGGVIPHSARRRAAL